MSLYGKVGDQVIVRDNLNNVLNMHQPNNFYPQNNFQNQPIQNTQMNQMPNGNQQFDFTYFIRMNYHNPASIDTSVTPSAAREDYLRQVKDIRAPDLSSLPKILESCDSLKSEYQTLITFNANLDDILAKRKNEANSKKSNVYDTISSVSNAKTSIYSSQSNTQAANPFSHLPPQKGYTDVDVQKFVNKFKCAKEMAVGYLEAFQNYGEAENQFIANTGWKA